MDGLRWEIFIFSLHVLLTFDGVLFVAESMYFSYLYKDSRCCTVQYEQAFLLRQAYRENNWRGNDDKKAANLGFDCRE